MLIGLLGSAFAQDPLPPPGEVTDVQIKAAIDALYGRDIPQKALCVERPTLPEPIGTVVAVATKRGERGCVLVGVMVGADLQEPQVALAKVIPPAVFAKLPTQERVDLLLAWTDQVLLAFDTPSETVPGTASSTKSTSTVTRRFLRRSERDLGIDDITARYSYNAALEPTVTETVHAKWQTNFFSRPVHLEGVDEQTVLTALATKGQRIAECFGNLWASDPTAAGRVVFEWTVASGKVDALTVESSPSEPVNGPLAACYGRYIADTAWPPEANGRVRWSFAATRGEIQ